MTPRQVQNHIIDANLSRGLEIPEDLSTVQYRSRLILVVIAAFMAGMIMGHVFTRAIDLAVETRLSQETVNANITRAIS